MPSSPPPTKYARVELDNGESAKKESGEGKKACPEFTANITDVIARIKSEPPEDVGKLQIKTEPISFDQSLSRARSNSLHSTTRFLPCHEGLGPSKCNSPTCSPVTSAYHGRGKPRRMSMSFSPNRLSTPLGASSAGDTHHDQPDSSTGTCEQLMREGGRRSSVSGMSQGDDHPPATTSTCSNEAVLCQVCGDLAAGFYCDAYICEACKKFFIRASKLERPRYVCLRQKNCAITKESRVHCQYCRYQKCLQLNMHYSKDGHKGSNKVGVQEIPCRVCAAPSSGFHFGALTCEGCKGFFRRMVKEREAYSYKCSRSGSCEVNAMTRNMCKACRYHKCLQIGMSVEGSRIGRQPNAVKHAITLEAKKQVALKTEPDNTIGENSSPGNFNFDSVELDPCLPGDIDESIQPMEPHQESAPVDVHPSPPRKTEEPRFDQESSISISRESSVPVGTGKVVSSTGQIQPEFKFLHQTQQVCSDHGFHPSPHSADLNPCPSSLNMPKDLSKHSFRRPQRMQSPYPDNQPQDLSIDLSLPRAFTTNIDCSTYHTTLSTSSPTSVQSMHSPISTSSAGHHVPPCPSPSPLPSPGYSPTDYSCPVTHTFHHRSYFSGHSTEETEHHMPTYQTRADYRVNSPVFDIESYRNYNDHSTNRNYNDHNTTQDINHNPQQEAYINRLDCPGTQHFDHYVSSIPVFNLDQGHHHTTPLHHRHEPELLHQVPPLIARQADRDKSCLQLADEVYATHIDRGEEYMVPSNLSVFQESSCEVHHSLQEKSFNLSPHHWSRSPSNIPPQAQPPLNTAPSRLLVGYSQKESRPNPVLTPTHEILMAPSPAPILDKVAESRDQNYMSMSNEELNSILLDAAKNLTNFCVVHRAKSTLFDENRFKDVDSTWDKMMEHFHFHAKFIVRFAKRVPGFRRLKLDDQVLLLRVSTYSLVILNHSRAYELETGFYNYFNFTQREIRRIRELFPEFDVIHNHYKHIGIMSQRLHLTEMEYAYLSCMLLLNDENPGLEDIGRTKELKERYMDAFQEYEVANFSGGSLRFDDLLRRLTDFSPISMEHNVAVGLVITKNSQLHIPQLYAEMYAQNSCTMDGAESGS